MAQDSLRHVGVQLPLVLILFAHFVASLQRPDVALTQGGHRVISFGEDHGITYEILITSWCRLAGFVFALLADVECPGAAGLLRNRSELADSGVELLTEEASRIRRGRRTEHALNATVLRTVLVDEGVRQLIGGDAVPIILSLIMFLSGSRLVHETVAGLRRRVQRRPALRRHVVRKESAGMILRRSLVPMVLAVGIRLRHVQRQIDGVVEQ